MSRLALLLKFIERHNADPESLRAAEAAYALANGTANVHRLPGEDRTLIHHQPLKGTINWTALPPVQVSVAVHMISFLKEIEQASIFLGTDHTKTVENLVCGNVIKTIVLSHPQFVPYTQLPEPLPTVGRCVYHGALARRFVLFDPDLQANHGYLATSTGKVFIAISEHRFICNT